MPNDNTTTSANNVLILSVTSLLPPTRIQGYAPDDMLTSDVIDQIETSMGVDGRMSAGWVAAIVNTTVMLQADSESIKFFDTWIAAQASAREVYFASGTYFLPGINQKFDLNRGVLKSFPKIPSAGRVLRPRAYMIQWESVTASPS